jgi:hypothetical protein
MSGESKRELANDNYSPDTIFSSPHHKVWECAEVYRLVYVGTKVIRGSECKLPSVGQNMQQFLEYLDP